MAIYKLNLEDFDQVDYSLIAIHSTFDDYRLAYKINQKLGISLFKDEKDIAVNVEGINVFFSRFTYTDYENILVWDLIQNNQILELASKKRAIDLFDANSFTRKVHILSELSKADYLLKIEIDSDIKINEIAKKINKIESVTTAYQVNTNELKSKNNLIF